MSSAAGALRPRDVAGTARLPARELLGAALQGLRTRRLRAALSALGIAIGIGAMVAVVGVSSSSQAKLLATIDSLGTNLLTVSPGTTFTGNSEVLPDTSVPKIGHMLHVDSDVAVYQLPNAVVLRTPFVPSQQTGGIGVDAAGENLPEVMGTSMASGHFIDAIASRYPEVVLGAQAAAILQINQVGGHLEVYLGNTWFHGGRDHEAGTAGLDAGLDRVHLAPGRRAPVRPGRRTPRRSMSAPTSTTSSPFRTCSPRRPTRRTRAAST